MALRGKVLVPRCASGLPKDSVANVSRLVTMDRVALTERVRPLPVDMIRALTVAYDFC